MIRRPPRSTQRRSSAASDVDKGQDLDTMSFEGWLQFVFIPKMTNLVNTRNPLPDNLKLMPMAERSFEAKGNQSELMKVINEIDLMFSPS